jgi:hypothetical protein
MTIENASNINPKVLALIEANFDKIDALTLESADALMADVAVKVLEKAPQAKTLELYHMTEELNEYNSVSAKTLLDSEGSDILDEDPDVETWIQDLLCEYSGDFLILLPETIDLHEQAQLLA